LELAYSKEVKIKDLTDGSQIIALLNYLYVLLSVKKDNQLNEIEESVLNGVIVSSFKNWTINEIKHAFRMAIDGTLDIDLYQKLDSITFGKVMKKYNTFKREKIKNFKTIGMKKVEEIVTDSEKIAIQEEFYTKCILPYIKTRKTAKEPIIDWATYSIFQYFWKKGDIKINDKDKIKYSQEADKLYTKSIKKRRFKGERVDLNEMLSHRNKIMYSSCIALHDKVVDLDIYKSE
tara:strand:- start:1541 stop:2239 length:699 start_codon:yes stop_codon:yes gene_type:complete